MRNPVLIGATVMGAVLLTTLPVSVKWSAENNLSLSQDKAYAVVGSQQRPEAWLAFIEGIHGGRSDAARLA